MYQHLHGESAADTSIKVAVKKTNVKAGKISGPRIQMGMLRVAAMRLLSRTRDSLYSFRALTVLAH